MTYQCPLNSETFKEYVNKYITEVDEVIETGTFLGQGSTKVFADTGKPVITIESCLDHYIEAKHNLKKYNNVTQLFASSLKRDEMELHIERAEYNGTYEGGSNPIEFYKNEINGWSQDPPIIEDILFPLINNSKKQLVFLDSAGGVGYLEFLEFMKIGINKTKKILILDDVCHVKHQDSVKKLNELNIWTKVVDNRFSISKFE